MGHVGGMTEKRDGTRRRLLPARVTTSRQISRLLSATSGEIPAVCHRCHGLNEEKSNPGAIVCFAGASLPERRTCR